MNNALTLENINITIEDHAIIKGVSLTLRKGQIACLLGPSGCGKTTTLRSIAGLQSISAGHIAIANKEGKQRVISTPHHQLPIEQRNIGMVFQNFALFPHLTIKQNIFFGLKNKTIAQKDARTSELLELINLPYIADRYPHELSGGQQQRVALARAMAPKPDILLLDEPFSSIDVELRQQLVKDVRTILKAEDITALMVTHDQLEAFAIADAIGVMKDGELLQWSAPYSLYHEPINKFVANFIGQGTFIRGKIKNGYIHTALSDIEFVENEHKGIPQGTDFDILIRPDDIIHDDDSKLMATVIEKRFLGSEFLYELKLKNKETVLCYAPSHHNHTIGEKIGIKTDLEHIVWF